MLASILTLAVAAPAPPADDAATRCAALLELTIPGVALEVTGAEWHPAGPPPARPGPFPPPSWTMPAHCRLDGMIDRRTGAGGKTYGIGFALALPDEWSGRFLMQGGGGLNGNVGLPVGPVAAGDTPALLRGFAVASTDTGHQSPAVFDATFMQDQQAALDFAYVAVGRVGALAQRIVSRYYGRSADHSYFTGCSTGGREGMLMAQRYPALFDGIVSGAPAMRTGHSNLALMTKVVALNRIAPKDESGKPVSGQALTDEDRQVVLTGLLEACDNDDGFVDGLIFDTRGCDFDPGTLACSAEKTELCLSAEKIEAIRKAFAGPRDSHGHQVYPGFPYDSGITASGPFIPGFLSPGAGPPGPPRLDLEQDVDEEAWRVDHNPQQVLTDTALWTNLGTFSGRGGKIAFFHGVSDPWFSAYDTLQYYEKLGDRNGGAEKVREWSRLFLVPGMGHCGGGNALDQFDLLGAVVDWVENGQAPDSVVATGRAFPGRSRPLCAWPRHAHYTWSGHPQDARFFECRE